MQLCLTLEHRFLQTPDGKIWTITQCGYDFYREYLNVFDSVRVISRVFPVAEAQANFLPVEGPGVEFYSMPGYKGPVGFLTQFASVRAKAKHAVPTGSAVILRVHSQIANSVEHWLTKKRLPFALEVVADPYDVLSPAANQHPAAPLARRYFTRQLQRQCKQAVAVSYVTQTYLQQRYPPQHNQQCVRAVSDVSLAPECFATRPRTGLNDPAHLRIIFVGTLESLYKGPDLLIEAVALCKEKRVPVNVRFLGIGQKTQALKAQCDRLGITDQVEFVGSVTAGEPVRRELDAADLFVLPSRAEGVPRAMLEAMARGLPCLGSSIGGIPELLHKEDLVLPENPAYLAATISDVFSQPGRLQRMSMRNLLKSSKYSTAMLADRRREFYNTVKELTARVYDSRSHDWRQNAVLQNT